MNYSTQDTVSPYREKKILSSSCLSACVPYLRRYIPNGHQKKKKNKTKKKKTDKKNHHNHMQAGAHASNQKKRLTSGHLREAKAGKSIDCCCALSVAYQSILLTWLLGHHLLRVHVEIRRVAWKWLVTNEPSGLSLCRPCPVHRRRRCRCRRQACQPAFFWWDGWMDGCIHTYYLDSHVLDGCYAVLCWVGTYEDLTFKTE